MSPEQQLDILKHTYQQLSDFCGKPPVGSVAPWWEVSKEGTEMMLDMGILYGAFRFTLYCVLLNAHATISQLSWVALMIQITRSSTTIVRPIGSGWEILGNLLIIARRQKSGWNRSREGKRREW